MIISGCFCHLNICLNLKSSKWEGQSLNTQIFVKCVWWKKAKVKALEKKVNPHPNQCSYVPIYTQEFSPLSVLLFPRSYKNMKAASLWLHSQPCNSSGSFPRLWQPWFRVDFSSGLTAFHSSSISHCWLGLSSFSGIITTWSLSYVLPPEEQEEKKEIVFDTCRFCSLQGLVERVVPNLFITDQTTLSAASLWHCANNMSITSKIYVNILSATLTATYPRSARQMSLVEGKINSSPILNGYLALAIRLAAKYDAVSAITLMDVAATSSVPHVLVFFFQNTPGARLLIRGGLVSKCRSSSESFIASLKSRSPHIMQSGRGLWESPVAINPYFK